MQHMPSNSSQPCPCASSKKSTAARFCRVACLIESTSVSNPDKASKVELVCLASQQPNLFNNPNALPATTPGTKKDAKTCFSKFQKVRASSQSLAKECKDRLSWVACVWFKSMVKFGASIVRRPIVHGPPTVRESNAGHVQSPQMTNIPQGTLHGEFSEAAW